MNIEELAFFHELEGLVLVDGFDDAFMGLGSRVNDDDVAIYDEEKMIDILINRDEMSAEEAREYFEYNIRGAFYGERTPIYLSRLIMEYD
tara:strand:+ start:2536 stop:2805 length:270 start_codon:yes stop_codon:yes gene_type:complete